jgi:hypothetical protein
MKCSLQPDVQADALGADIVGAAVGGLHHARPASGHDHEATLRPVPLAGARHQARELARGGVDALRVEHTAASAGARASRLGRGDARAAEHDHGAVDPVLAQQQLRFQQLQLEAHRPELGAQQELLVGEGEAAARRSRLRSVGLAFGPGQILAGARQTGWSGARLAHPGSTTPRAGAGRQSSAAPSPPGTKM